MVLGVFGYAGHTGDVDYTWFEFVFFALGYFLEEREEGYGDEIDCCDIGFEYGTPASKVFVVP
jgi:hypothetical protein